MRLFELSKGQIPLLASSFPLIINIWSPLSKVVPSGVLNKIKPPNKRKGKRKLRQLAAQIRVRPWDGPMTNTSDKWNGVSLFLLF